MAVRSNSYETTVVFKDFAGIYQGGENNVPVKYAQYSENCDTSSGVLREALRDSKKIGDGDGSIDVGAETFIVLHRRFVRKAFADYEKVAIIVDSTGTVLAQALTEEYQKPEWTSIGPDDLVIKNPAMSYVLYEVNSYYELNGKRVAPYTEGAKEVESPDPIDVVLMTNADDGMFIVYGDTLDVVPFKIQPKGASEEIKIGVIALHAERIWGAAIAGDSDRLVYSAPFNPLDWEQNSDYPEDGAGDIRQPSWDGDTFVALKSYGNYLLAIKRHRIWRVSGTNPGEYYFKEQFGGGTIAPNTVVVHNDLVYMLSDSGLMIYDGTSVQSFRQEYIKDIMDSVLNKCEIVYLPEEAVEKRQLFFPVTLDTAVAEMKGDTYCLALPGGVIRADIVDGGYSADPRFEYYNNCVIEFDSNDGSFNFKPNEFIGSFCRVGNELWYMSKEPDADFAVNGMWRGGVYKYAQGELEEANVMRWRSAPQDLGALSATKTGFEVYIVTNVSADVLVRIITEKKVKEKRVYTLPNETERIRLNAKGRAFQIEIVANRSNPAVDSERLCFPSGIEVKCELDWD